MLNGNKTGIPQSLFSTWARKSGSAHRPGWNPCKPHAEDAPRLSKYHAKVFGMTPQKPKTKQNTPSTSTIYAGTRQNLRSHASTPRISKLHAEDIRRDIHRFHPGSQGNACPMVSTESVPQTYYRLAHPLTKCFLRL